MKNESILDFPVSTELNQKIWLKNENGLYVLTEQAESVILEIVEWAKKRFKIPGMSVRVIGSIASNAFSSTSDIDIHISSSRLIPEKAELFNVMLKKAFNDELLVDRPDLASIDGIRTEIFMQPYPVVDMKSVGCYDVLEKKWLVGPEMQSLDFDPYYSYGDKALANIDDLLQSTREILLQAYECAFLILKSKTQSFKLKKFLQLLRLCKKGQKRFLDIKDRRSALPVPLNMQDAINLGKSLKWKIADSSYKLLYKFGYLSCLRALRKIVLKEEFKDLTPTLIAAFVIDLFHDSMKVSYDDAKSDILLIQEGPASSLAKFAAIASLLAILNFIPLKAVETGLSKMHAKNPLLFNQLSPDFLTIILKACFDLNQYGGMCAANNVNVIAWTLMSEALNLYKKYGKISFLAVASTIWNRAGGDPLNFVGAISRKAQYSEWNSYAGGWTDSTYLYHLPGNITNPAIEEMWKLTNLIAVDMLYGNFKSVIGRRNMIANEKKDNKKAFNSWGKNCDLVIGDHAFGYDHIYDGWHSTKEDILNANLEIPDNSMISVKTTIAHSIEKGETISSIAKLNNIAVKAIYKANPVLAKQSTIQIGLQLIIPQTMTVLQYRDSILKSSQLIALKLNALKNSAPSKTITVKSGDSLWKIAKNNNITVQDIIAKNPSVTAKSVLKIGLKIKI